MVLKKTIKKTPKNEDDIREIPSEEMTKEDEDILDTPLETPQEPGMDLMDLMNSPMAKTLLDGATDLFKKEERNPDICKITIEAPSAVVLKLFQLE